MTNQVILLILSTVLCFAFLVYTLHCIESGTARRFVLCLLITDFFAILVGLQIGWMLTS